MSFWQNRKVFVTGCTGFLGSWLTSALVEKGAHVVGLIRDNVPNSTLFTEKTISQITTVQGCLTDYALLERALNEHEIDSVFHLAAQAIVGVSNRNPMSTFEANIRGTWQLLEACRRNSLVSRIVVASSDKAYGVHSSLPYSEDFALQGTHPYDVSKSCADLISATYHNTYGTPVCVTRCANLFGPGDLNFNRIIPGTFQSISLNERPIIRSDGTPKRDYIYIDDVVDAYLLLAEQMENKSLHGQAFNFGTGTPISVLALTQLILRVAGRQDLEPIIQNTAKSEIPDQYLSCDKAQKILGWRASDSLEQRLSQTYDWYNTLSDA